MPEPKQPRSYDSTGRRASAQVNRARILDAARALFIERGFAGTSVTAIAAAAGVSGPTVFAAFGSKVNLLKEAAETAIVGDVDAVPMAERPEMRHVEAGATPEEVLDRLAELLARRSAAVQPIFAVMYGARDSHPEIAALVERLDEQRLAGCTRLARTVASRAEVDDEDWVAEVRDCLWVTMSTTLYEAFVLQRGWDVARYQAWLRAALRIPLLRRPSRPGVGDSPRARRAG